LLRAKQTETAFLSMIEGVDRVVDYQRKGLYDRTVQLMSQARRMNKRVREMLDHLASSIEQFDPRRALSLGYALVRSKYRLVRSVRDVDVGSRLDVSLSDGELTVNCIKKTSYDKK